MSALGILSALNLAVEQVEAVTDAEVDVTASSDDAGRLPLVLVQAGAPAPLPTGRPELGASFRLVVSCFACTRIDALKLANQVVTGLLASWRAGRRTESGWFSHLEILTLPTLAGGGALADDVWQFDAVLDAVARH